MLMDKHLENADEYTNRKQKLSSIHWSEIAIVFLCPHYTQ